MITHDDWHGNPLDFPDLALIKLAKKVTFRTKSFQTDTIAPACLSNENIQKGVYDSEAFVAGKLFQISNETMSLIDTTCKTLNHA